MSGDFDHHDLLELVIPVYGLNSLPGQISTNEVDKDVENGLNVVPSRLLYS
jgi:hypothetical protein